MSVGLGPLCALRLLAEGAVPDKAPSATDTAPDTLPEWRA